MKPSLAPEKEYEGDRNAPHYAQTNGVPPIPIQLRHVVRRTRGVKVHAVNSSDKRQRNEDGRDDRQQFHHIVHAIANRRKIYIHQA